MRAAVYRRMTIAIQADAKARDGDPAPRRPDYLYPAVWPVSRLQQFS